MHKITLVLSCAIIASGAASDLTKASPTAQQKRTQDKPKTLTNPKSTYKVRLEQHVHFGSEDGWRRVSVISPDGKTILVKTLTPEPGDCLQPADGGGWSPDAKYLTLIHMINYNTPNSRQDTAYILDVAHKVDVNFRAEDETPMTFDHTTFDWIPSKPHSISVQNEAGKTVEALPED